MHFAETVKRAGDIVQEMANFSTREKSMVVIAHLGLEPGETRYLGVSDVEAWAFGHCERHYPDFATVGIDAPGIATEVGKLRAWLECILGLSAGFSLSRRMEYVAVPLAIVSRQTNLVRVMRLIDRGIHDAKRISDFSGSLADPV